MLDQTFNTPINYHHPRGIWIYGPSGKGKSWNSRLVADNLGFSVYIKTHSKWWENYHGEQVALLDDLHPKLVESKDFDLTTSLKTWLDSYSFQGE